MKNVFLICLGMLSSLVNADCLTPLVSSNIHSGFTNQLACQNTSSIWVCAGHGKYAPDGSIRVMTPTNSHGRTEEPTPVRAVQFCLYPDGNNGYNALSSATDGFGHEIDLMYCSTSRAAGLIEISNHNRANATLWILNPNDPLYSISNGDPINLNDFIVPNDLPNDPEGFPRTLIRADDIRDNNILVWAASANYDSSSTWEYRYGMLMNMNIDDCLANQNPIIVIVPNVIGYIESEAQTQLNNVGLEIGNISRTYNPSQPGTVIGQNPASGTEVNEGSGINLTVSLGPEQTTLPIISFEAENYNAFFNVVTETGTPSSGGANVGYISENSFTQYLIDFTPNDNSVLNHTYTLRFTYANWDGAKTVTVWDTYSGNTSTINLPEHSAGYWNWYTTSIPFDINSTALNGGTTEIRFTYHGGTMNVDSIEFTP